MAKEQSSEPAIPFLRWSGKGGSGITPMHDRDAKNNITPWSGERLAEELASHEKFGNKVSFGAIHNGKMVGDTTKSEPIKKTATTIPAAKPAAKKAAPKAAAKPAAKPAAKKAK